MAVFDSNFGISDGDLSRQENGEDIYAYMGDAAIERRRLREETGHLKVDKKKASGVMLQMLRTSKRTQK